MHATIDETSAEEFLACGRVALIGASPDPRNFGHTIFKALVDHGIDVVPVNPNSVTVDDARCYPNIGSVPCAVDGALIAVHAELAERIVDECIAAGVPRIWLFQGLGSEGAASPAAIDRCLAAGVEVVPGACPLMFFDDASWFHRAHRAARRHVTHTLAVRPAHPREEPHHA